MVLKIVGGSSALPPKYYNVCVGTVFSFLVPRHLPNDARKVLCNTPLRLPPPPRSPPCRSSLFTKSLPPAVPLTQAPPSRYARKVLYSETK